MYKKFLVILSIFALNACSDGTDYTTKVKAMQKKDKNLSCKEILLEMNEAEFYKKMAYKNRGPKLKNVLMPLGYISTYMDAEEAIEAADARISYLDKIYEIMRCDDENNNQEYYEQQNQQPGYRAYPPYGYYEYSPVPQTLGYQTSFY